MIFSRGRSQRWAESDGIRGEGGETGGGLCAGVRTQRGESDLSTAGPAFALSADGDWRMISAADPDLALARAEAAPGASVGYLFRAAPEAPDDPDMDARLAALAQAMAEDEADPRADFSGLPMIFPLFGMFLAHDLTAMADLRTTSGRSLEIAPLRPRARDEIEGSLVNLRDGMLRLDSLYRADAGDTALSARLARLMREPGAPARMRLDTAWPSPLGRTLLPRDRGADLPRLGRLLEIGAAGDERGEGAGGLTREDLAALPPGLRRRFLREGAPVAGLALIGDQRNDNHLTLSQLHLALLRFHNRVADWLADRRAAPPEALFDAARRLVRWHVQWLALNVWLPGLVDEATLARVRASGAPFYTEFRAGLAPRGAQRQPAPLEWWAAVSRLELSMTRFGFPLNGMHPQADLGLLLGSTGRAMTTPRLSSDRVLDWTHMVRPPEGARGWGARAISTHAAPDELHADLYREAALRALRRGHALNLACAQDCVAAMNDVHPGLVRPLGWEALTGGHTGEAVRDGLAERTPLWFYILREAEVLGEGRRLGPLGGAILAETLVGMIAHDPDGVLAQRSRDGGPWRPSDGAVFDEGRLVIDGFEALLKAAEVM